MKPRKLLQKEHLPCGCLRYTYTSVPGLVPQTESEVYQMCASHTLVPAPVGRNLADELMEGPAPPEPDYVPVSTPCPRRWSEVIGVMMMVVLLALIFVGGMKFGTSLQRRYDSPYFSDRAPAPLAFPLTEKHGAAHDRRRADRGDLLAPWGRSAPPPPWYSSPGHTSSVTGSIIRSR